jgi:homoserine kinase
MTSHIQRVHVQVPATSANLGPGFDCMALALDLWNEIVLDAAPGHATVSVEGEGEHALPKDSWNPVVQAAARVFQKANVADPGFSVACTNRIPVASGMGSSAAAAVGGLVAANAVIGSPHSHQNLIQLCLPLEAHADNAVAAFVGGLVVLSVEDGRVLWRRYELAQMQVCVIVTQKKISTGESGSFFPEKVDHRDAVANLGRALLAAEALRSADYRLMAEVMQDRLHQPYRLPHLPGAGGDPSGRQAGRRRRHGPLRRGSGRDCVCGIRAGVDPQRHARRREGKKAFRTGVHPVRQQRRRERERSCGIAVSIPGQPLRLRKR